MAPVQLEHEQRDEVRPPASPRISPRLKTAIFILWNVVAIAAVFAVLELGMRAIQHQRLGPGAYETEALRDRFTGWRNNPAFSRADIHINRQGFRREQDVPVAKPPDTVRIFLVGGSAAFGAEGLYPEIDNRYSRLYGNQLIDYYLEQKLNQTFPGKHWEVINAGVSEYRLHQDLALIESVLLQYRPDYLLLLDGHNDIAGLAVAPANYDVYASTSHLEEFNQLANPRSVHAAVFFMYTWLRSNSALFRFLSDHLQFRTMRSNRLHSASKERQFTSPVKFSDLTPEEEAQFTSSHNQISLYLREARQIHRILDLDGVKTVFLLQPELILTHKPLTDSERRLADYHRKVSGPMTVYSYEQFHPEISGIMSAAATHDGFLFLDLTDVFDRTPGQTFSDSCHLTAEGNRVIAERVFQFLGDSFAETARTGATLPRHN
jgi:lysophospholipase L1-like esterase